MNNSELRKTIITLLEKINDAVLLKRIYLILLVSTRR